MRIPVVLASCALVLAACGGGGDGSASSSAASSSAPASSSLPATSWSVSDCATLDPPIKGAPPAGSVEKDGVATTAEVGTAPTVSIDSAASPAKTLVTVDVVEGTGEAVPAGATVTVDYCGVGLDSGAIFDSSFARGQPATFPLDGVIAGWQEGIPGMKPGGRRVLIIPGDLAYGPQPPPGSGIGPNETLVFVVDMLSSP